MEVEAQKRMVKRWEDDQKVAVIVRDQDSRMAKVIRESRWNVKYEYDANHAKSVLPLLSRTSKGGATASV
jgi:hypothetical protein